MPGLSKFAKMETPVKSAKKNALPLVEAFYTLQGEGAHQGRAAYFIRLGGCDVGCVWCDVKESWEAGLHPLTDIDTIVDEAAAHPSKLIVVTGGEPLMYNLDNFCKTLKAKGLQLHLETSGAHPLSGQWDWITLSPKKFKAPLPAILDQAHELKVVIFNKSDFEWADQHATQVNEKCKLYLQPEWDQSAKMLPQIIDYVKSHPKWQISLQAHKFMDIP